MYFFIFHLPTNNYPGFLHQPYLEAAIKRQLVSPESERDMLEWMEQSAASRMPFDHREIRDHASDLADQH